MGILLVETTDRLEACLPRQPGWLFSESLRYLKSRNAIGRAFRGSVDDILPRARI